MTPELNNARAYLRTAQDILAHWRSQPNAAQWLITQAEQRVLGSLEWVWQAQCRAVLNVDDECMNEPWVRRFVNQIDWAASGPTPHIPGIKGMIRVKEPA